MWRTIKGKRVWVVDQKSRTEIRKDVKEFLANKDNTFSPYKGNSFCNYCQRKTPHTKGRCNICKGKGRY